MLVTAGLVGATVALLRRRMGSLAARVESKVELAYGTRAFGALFGAFNAPGSASLSMPQMFPRSTALG
ncbi:hypothetical protein PR001_g31187 [Phytophthora rubi]|nr:hypothetical protein PR001_g31187 [Phytophthora rubi]